MISKESTKLFSSQLRGHKYDVRNIELNRSSLIEDCHIELHNVLLICNDV